MVVSTATALATHTGNRLVLARTSVSTGEHAEDDIYEERRSEKLRLMKELSRLAQSCEAQLVVLRWLEARKMDDEADELAGTCVKRRWKNWT